MDQMEKEMEKVNKDQDMLMKKSLINGIQMLRTK